MKINGIDIIKSIQVLEYRVMCFERMIELLFAQINIIVKGKPPVEITQGLADALMEEARIEINAKYGSEVIKVLGNKQPKLRLVVDNTEKEPS
jgi:hypothetical protein